MHKIFVRNCEYRTTVDTSADFAVDDTCCETCRVNNVMQRMKLGVERRKKQCNFDF